MVQPPKVAIIATLEDSADTYWATDEKSTVLHLFLTSSEIFHALSACPVFLLIITCLPAASQQNAQDVPTTGAKPTAPTLLPQILTVSTPKHCNGLDGVVKFATTIDANSLPQELKALEASDRRLVGFAMELVEAQRFEPGTIYGSNTAVSVELTVGLHTCAQREKHPTDGNFYRFTLRAHPLIALAVAAPAAAQEIVSAARSETATTEQVGGQISAPIATLVIDPAIPVSRKLLKRGVCLVGVTIDANGLPQNIHVVRSLDPELDSNVIEAVKQWRFKPSLSDGRTPVAVEGTVGATFEYFEKNPVAFAAFTPEAPEKVQAAIGHHEKRRYDLEPLNADEVMARYYPVSRVSGRCVVSMMIDASGVPQNVHVIKGLEPGLDMDTVAMVEHFRYKPVMRDEKTPVPVALIMPVRYRGTEDRLSWKDLFMDLLTLAIL